MGIFNSGKFSRFIMPVLVLIGKEKVFINKEDPFMSDVKSESYPYSHSIILSSLFYAILTAIFCIVLENALIFPLFFIGTASY